jgi:hypothetical protein
MPLFAGGQRIARLYCGAAPIARAWRGAARVYEKAGGNDAFTTLLLHFDGADASTSFTDSSVGGAGSPHSFTANGNAQIDTAQSRFGGASAFFDGTGDFVTTPDHADFALGAGDFTVDFWLRLNNTGDNRLICGQVDATNTITNRSIYFQRLAANRIRFGTATGSTANNVDSTTTLSDGVWYHVAGVRTGGTLKLFVDGVQEGGDVAISGAINNSTGAFSVGRLGDVDAQYFHGWIDEFRLSAGIARWTANFTPPAAPYS